MNIITVSLAAATTAGLAAALLPMTAPANAGSAAEPSVLTYRMAARDAESRHIDIGRKGDSVGDRYLGAITLRADGAVAGRLQLECTVLDVAYEGHLCTMAVLLEGGSITFAAGGVNKRIPGVGGRFGDVFAVTGGFGEYEGATGQLAVDGDAQTVTISLTSAGA